ncbi:MAG: TRAP transporter small permease [Burkholderiales bacterium]
MRSALGLLRRIEGALLAALMLAMAAAYSFNVAVRAFDSAQAAKFAWIEEACLYALAWVVFLGLGLALEQGRQIAMTSLLEHLAPRLRRGVKLAIDLTGAVFSLYIAKLSLDIMLLVVRSGQLSPSLDISTGWLYGAMPLGFLLLAFRYVMAFASANGRVAAHSASTAH